MAVFGGQVSGSATATKACVVPPGPGEAVFTNTGTVPVYIGFGTSASTTGSTPIPSGGVLSFTLFQGSGGGTAWVITPGGTIVVGFLISSAYGLSQPGTQ